MSIEISPEAIREGALAVTAAVPVVSVAYYTIRSVPDLPGSLTVRVPPSWRRGPRHLVVVAVAGRDRVSADGWRLSLALGKPMDRAVLIRAPLGLVLSFTALLCGHYDRLSRILLAASMFLLVSTFGALMQYTTTVVNRDAALAPESSARASEMPADAAAEPDGADAVGPRSEEQAISDPAEPDPSAFTTLAVCVAVERGCELAIASVSVLVAFSVA